MKVNFWQALGVLLLIVGVVVAIARKKTGTNDTITAPAETTPATTQTAP